MIRRLWTWLPVFLLFAALSTNSFAQTPPQVPETAEGKGWNLAGGIDFSKLPDLPELIVGRAEARTAPNQVTCFVNNLGLGYQFAAAGALVYRKAKESERGHELPTDWFTEDVHP